MVKSQTKQKTVSASVERNFQTQVILHKKRFVRAVEQKTGEKICQEKEDKWPPEQDAYTLHRPTRVGFPQNRVLTL